MANEFQIWLKNQGYYRSTNTLGWMKNGTEVSGKELFEKLNEFKQLK